MDSELLTGLLLGACALGFGLGAVWQFARRKPKTARRIERIGARTTAPKPQAQPAAEEKVAPRTPEVGMHRPAMLAITSVSGDLTAAEVFIQRAHELDEPHFRAMEIDPHDLEAVQSLFEHVNALAWTPGSDLSHNVFEVTFSPVIERALESGFQPRTNAVASDLQIIGVDEHGLELGEPMATSDYGWGAPTRIHSLWGLLNPAEHEHPLAKELRSEMDLIKSMLPKVQLFVTALEGMQWEQEIDELFDLSRDVRRLGLEEGRAQQRTDRADDLAAKMRAHNERIDEALEALTNGIRTLQDADDALNKAIPLMHERELAILCLRAIALMRVISSEDYMHGMRCSSRIAENVKAFPDVHPLLNRARQAAYDAAETRSRAMTPAELKLLGDVKKDADHLAEVHDEVVAELKKKMHELQEAIDRYLIVQGRPRRHAVRMDADGRVEAVLVLEH